MADFSQSYVGGEQGSPVQPLPPVVDDKSLIGLNLLSGLSGGIERTIDKLEIRKEKERKELLQAQQDQSVSTFVRGQLSLADAVDTGGMSSLEARTRMRANLSRAIADNPGLAVDLGKAHTATIKSTGLGQAVYEGTESEKQQNTIETEAVEAGWVRPNQSPEDKEKAAYAYQDFKRSMELMGFEQKKLALESSKVGLQSAKVGLVTSGIQQQSARLALAEKQNKLNAQSALGKASNAYIVKLQGDLENIRQAKEDGRMDATQAAMAVDQAFMVVDQVSRQVGAEAGTDYVNNITAPMKQMAENYKGYMTGEIQLNDLKTRTETNVAQQTLNLVNNPQSAKLVATSKLFPNSDVITLTQTNDLVMNFVSGGQDINTKPADVLPDYQEGKESLNTYLKMMQQTMGKVNSGTAVDTEGTKEDVNNNLTNILRSIDVYGASTSNASDYNGVMDFLSKTEVGRYITTQGGLPDTVAANKAAQAIEYQYANVVLPLIKQEYDKSKTGGEAQITYYGRTEVPGVKGQQPTKDLITPQFIGSGVVFNVAPGDANSFSRAKAKELNDKVAPVLNRLIRVSAHLSGTTDYKSVYEQNYSQLFEPEVKTDAQE